MGGGLKPSSLIEVVLQCDNMYIFADDAKFYRHIEHPDDQEFLQLAINALHQWSKKWMLSLNSNSLNVKLCPMAGLLIHPQCILLWTKINRQFH